MLMCIRSKAMKCHLAIDTNCLEDELKMSNMQSQLHINQLIMIHLIKLIMCIGCPLIHLDMQCFPLCDIQLLVMQEIINYYMLVQGEQRNHQW